MLPLSVINNIGIVTEYRCYFLVTIIMLKYAVLD